MKKFILALVAVAGVWFCTAAESRADVHFGIYVNPPVYSGYYGGGYYGRGYYGGYYAPGYGYGYAPAYYYPRAHRHYYYAPRGPVFGVRFGGGRW